MSTAMTPRLHFNSIYCSRTISCAVIRTHRAVGSHPVGVTAAQSSVWYEGTVAVALVRALGPGQLAVESSPAWLTVALPIHTDAIVGARRIQTIHCIKPKNHHCEKTLGSQMNRTQARKCQIRAGVKNKLNIRELALTGRELTEDRLSFFVNTKR